MRDPVFALKIVHACALDTRSGTLWVLTGSFTGRVPSFGTLLFDEARHTVATLIGSIVGAPRGLVSVEVSPIAGKTPEALVGVTLTAEGSL